MEAGDFCPEGAADPARESPTRSTGNSARKPELGAPQRYASSARTSLTAAARPPYLPHAPHPRMWWLYAVTEVAIDEEPANPADGERVVDVLVLPPADAADYLEVHDPIHADVIRLAIALGEVG